MNGSIYRWHVVNTSGPSVLCIIDLWLSTELTVTNDMGRVLRDLGERMYLNDMLIIYRDSEGLWDGINLTEDPKGFEFYSLRVQSEDSAIARVLRRYNRRGSL